MTTWETLTPAQRDVWRSGARAALSTQVWYATEPACGCVTAAAIAYEDDGTPLTLATAQRDHLGMGRKERADDERTWAKAELDMIRPRLKTCTHRSTP